MNELPVLLLYLEVSQSSTLKSMSLQAAYAHYRTYASPSFSNPLLLETDGMSSMCRLPGSYTRRGGFVQSRLLFGGIVDDDRL